MPLNALKKYASCEKINAIYTMEITLKNDMHAEIGKTLVFLPSTRIESVEPFHLPYIYENKNGVITTAKII